MMSVGASCYGSSVLSIGVDHGDVDRYVVLERRVSSDDMVSSRYFEGFVSVLIAERSTPMLSPQGPLQQPQSGVSLDVGERGAETLFVRQKRSMPH